MRRLLVLAPLVLLLASCGSSSSSSGPSANDLLFLERGRRPSSGGRLCFVDFDVINTSSREIDLTVRFRALNAQGTIVDSDIELMSDIRPAERRGFELTFLVPCSQIASLERFDTTVRQSNGPGFFQERPAG